MRTALQAQLGDSIESLPVDEFSRRLVGFATVLAIHERQEADLLTRVTDFSPNNHGSALSA